MDAVSTDPGVVGEARLRVANCSGFFGDRLSGAREMVEGGPIDVLTGDWLAELTMLILAKQRRRDPSAGYARTFVRQMEETLGTCLERNIKVVTNAGGLNPRGCALAIEELAGRLGLAPVVATVTGDDVRSRLRDLEAAGERLTHLDTGAEFRAEGVEAVTANAYIGYRGIAEALQRGADVVITGRVADAALVVGPAAWRFGWAPDEWDRLAGAVVAGHVIECSAQATGGNFAFFDEVPGLEHCGFPIAEMAPDGSAVITKHPGTGGAVTVDTVTAQLLYEIGGARYLSPDVVCRFDTIRLAQVGDDRVRVWGTRGEPAPRRLKVGINFLGGYRNSVTFVLPGLDVRAKARLAEDSLFASVPGGRSAFDEVAVELTGGIDGDGAAADGRCHLRVTVLGPEEATVGRAFTDAAVQLTLASYPGFHTTGPPTAASEYGVFWPTTIHRRWVVEHVQVGDEQIDLAPLLCDGSDPVGAIAADGSSRDSPLLAEPVPPLIAPPRRADGGPQRGEPSSLVASAGAMSARTGAGTKSVPGGSQPLDHSGHAMTEVRLGRIYGARSGDKGGNANVGVWARSDRAYGWLRRELTPDAVQRLVPDTADHEVTRYELPNLRACNFVVRGLLGRGVAASTRVDPQAKGLGEELRAASVRVPRDVAGRPQSEGPRPA